jgi:hypothetical protein
MNHGGIIAKSCIKSTQGECLGRSITRLWPNMGQAAQTSTDAAPHFL